MTRQARLAPEGLTIVLPGTWVRIPLDDPAETVAFAKRFVKRQTGTADRLARVRRETVQELVSSARDAQQVGVHTYFMALEILPGIPFPAAMLFLDLDWPALVREDVEEGRWADALLKAFEGVEVGEAGSGPFGRRAELNRQLVQDEELLTLRLEYFVPYPDGSRLLVVRANVPNIPQAEPFALLFNEIVDSITFVGEAGGDGHAVSSR